MPFRRRTPTSRPCGASAAAGSIDEESDCLKWLVFGRLESRAVRSRGMRAAGCSGNSKKRRGAKAGTDLHCGPLKTETTKGDSICF